MDVSNTTSICPGCGVNLPSQGFAVSEKYNASGECQKMYEQLLYYTLSKRDAYFIHQLVVDTYAAQHSTDSAPKIRTAFALIGLYLVNEQGFNGRQVQLTHMRLPKFQWPSFKAPADTGKITIKDVINSPPGDERDNMIKIWSNSVWQSWNNYHQWIINTLNQLSMI